MIGQDGIKADRALGEYWEDVFITMVKARGWQAWPFNRTRGATFKDKGGNIYVSPDVWTLRRGSRQYVVEIKHKNPARNGCFGFELYRQESMLAIEDNYQNRFGSVRALFAVHNHDLAGGKRQYDNDVQHWQVQAFKHLMRFAHQGAPQKTYYNGALSSEAVPMMYYPVDVFATLEHFFGKEHT